MRVLKIVCWSALVGALACGDGVSAPETTFDGIKYTAATNTITSANGATQFTVLVTLENTTGGTLTRTYPATCPVRIKLYRASDQALLYDESRRDCDMSITATLTIGGRETAQVSSGVRFAQNVLGDSLPSTTYNVKALVLTECTKTVLIDAGQYTLNPGPQG